MEPTHLGLDDELISLVKGIMEEGLEESITIEDYSLEEIEAYMVSEDFEQLDELSKKTLGAYATKAAHQFADNKTQAQQEYDRGVHMQLHGLGNDKMRNDFAKKNFANSKDYMNKSIKRRRGLEKAIGKLTKESVELVENDLQTLFKHEKAAGFHPSTGESHYARKVGNKIHVAVHDDDNGHYTATFHINSKGGGDYEGNPNSEHKSKAEAIAAVNKRAGVKEEVEPIDELSKKTLGSYVKKATNSAVDNAHDLGRKKERSDEVDRYTNRNNIKGSQHDHGDVMKKAVDADQDSQDKSRLKMLRRLRGVNTATKKLTKESTDSTKNIFSGAPKTKAGWDYTNKKRAERNAEHEKQDPKMAGHYGQNMVDVEKAAKKAKEHGIKVDARDFDWKVRNGVRRGKLPEELEDYSMEELEDFMMSEDFEQLDELSKKTLGSYVKKASRDSAHKRGLAHSFSLNFDKSIDMNRISIKRQKGVDKATDKLTKEEVEEIEEGKTWAKLGYSSEHDYHKARYTNASGKKAPSGTSTTSMMIIADKAERESGKKLTKEEVEEIDEVSKELLGRYVTKASLKAAGHAYKASDDKSGKHIDKTFKRLDGIKVAAKKLTKEEVEEIEALAAKHGLGE